MLFVIHNFFNKKTVLAVLATLTVIKKNLFSWIITFNIIKTLNWLKFHILQVQYILIQLLNEFYFILIEDLWIIIHVIML